MLVHLRLFACGELRASQGREARTQLYKKSTTKKSDCLKENKKQGTLETKEFIPGSFDTVEKSLSAAFCELCFHHSNSRSLLQRSYNTNTTDTARLFQSLRTTRLVRRIACKSKGREARRHNYKNKEYDHKTVVRRKTESKVHSRQKRSFPRVLTLLRNSPSAAFCELCFHHSNSRPLRRSYKLKIQLITARLFQESCAQLVALQAMS